MAINFPTSPTVGSDYTYQGIKYTYQADGYWAVTTVGTQGVASPEDLNAGTDSVKYLTPTSFSGSKYDITISNFGSASQKDVGTAPNEVPLNSDLPDFGTAATKDTGTAPNEVPTNDNLGTAATRDVGTAAGDVLEVGAGGWLSQSGEDTVSEGYPLTLLDSISTVYRRNTLDNGVLTYSASIHFAAKNTWGRLRIHHQLRRAWIQGGIATSGTGWTAELLHTGNTTVDGLGFIKSASPIVKLYADKIEANDYKEIEDCTFERVNTGHYIIKGAPLLSRDGWYIETLKDRNNNIYFTLDYEELEDGVHVKTYEPDYSTGRATNGAPVDINEGRFVTLRFEEDPSLYPAPEEEPDLNSKQP